MMHHKRFVRSKSFPFSWHVYGREKSFVIKSEMKNQFNRECRV